MFAKVAVLLFAGCAVVLARPQDASSIQQQAQQYQNYLQQLNPNQAQAPLQAINQVQGYSQNQLAAVLASLNPQQLNSLLAGLNSYNQGYQNQVQSLIPNLNGGYNGGYNGNSKYQSPLLDLPNHAIDWSQNVVDGGVSRVGSALNQAYGNTEHVVSNTLDTVSEVGRRGLQDGTTLFKSGLGVLSTFPKLGLGLLSRQNNNNNNVYGF